MFLKQIVATACLVGAAVVPAAAADGTAIIRYDLSIAGFPIGSASLSALIQNNVYRVDVAAKIGGVLSLINDGRGAASANGRLGAQQPLASSYALSSRSGEKRTTVQMAMSAGSIRDVDISPVPSPNPDRIPVTSAHKRGIVDPVSALLMPVAGRGPVLTADACNRTLPVFDGAQRYDVTLRYSRTEKVSGGRGGYDGPAVVCSARYTPIAGHRERREQTRFMAANRDMEVWLAPIGDTRVLAPFKIIVATQIGRLVIGARNFDSAAPTMAASAN